MKTPRTRFHRIRLGFGNGYLIQAQRGCIVIDAGSKNQQQPFIRHLEKNNLSGDEVGLIVITHVHFDHVGSLKAIKELCKCPVAVHERESQLLRGGVVVFPPGTNLYAKAASYIGQKLMRPLFRFPSVEPDIFISEDFSLEPFGIPVDIIPTPGHTGGSLSVLLSSGQAFVGDLAANYLPFWNRACLYFHLLPKMFQNSSEAGRDSFPLVPPSYAPAMASLSRRNYSEENCSGGTGDLEA